VPISLKEKLALIFLLCNKWCWFFKRNCFWNERVCLCRA